MRILIYCPHLRKRRVLASLAFYRIQHCINYGECVRLMGSTKVALCRLSSQHRRYHCQPLINSDVTRTFGWRTVVHLICLIACKYALASDTCTLSVLLSLLRAMREMKWFSLECARHRLRFGTCGPIKRQNIDKYVCVYGCVGKCSSRIF